MNKQKMLDIAERVGTTAIEAGVAYLIPRLGDVAGWFHLSAAQQVEFIPIATPMLAAIKSWVATHWGNKNSASAVPSI